MPTKRAEHFARLLKLETWAVTKRRIQLSEPNPPPRPGRCRLILSINEHKCNVRPIFSQHETVLKAFRLSRKVTINRKVIYDVADTIYGGICDCPDFIFGRDGKDPKGFRAGRLLRRRFPRPASRSVKFAYLTNFLSYDPRKKNGLDRSRLQPN
jgi:hypothetical protein